ncbi:sugar ABC transporter permease [Actinophytocola xinjiangensis]|uniref:Sugar ABC transporter permease n=1 Tax=Actinophytocola xinjiangensis TaxID=485602 RepID=A0A7Z0WD24_9PSEU|nr:sugar ABC transporter permease [Actinophytocola xinjiangensis]
MRSSLLAPALAIGFSALLCAIALLVSGSNPASALGVMIGQVGEGQVAVDIVNSTAIYMLAALAAAIGFQMNLLNIGVEGQYRIGALVAAIVGSWLVLPPVLHWLVILLVAMLAGALWALIPAVLKVTRGVHEVLSTIMMNGIAFGLAAFLISQDRFGELVGNNISTEPIPESGQVPNVDLGDRGQIFGLVLLAVVAAAVYGLVLHRTRFGFELRASGESPTAAAAGGVNAKKMIMIALLTSGAVAGLVGMPEILGRDHAYTLNFPANYGFAGLGIALLGRNHPVGIAFGALLWAFLDKSKVALDNVGVPREIATIMQGAIVLSVVVAYEIVKRMDRAAEQQRVGRAMGTVEPVAADSGSAK